MHTHTPVGGSPDGLGSWSETDPSLFAAPLHGISHRRFSGTKSTYALLAIPTVALALFVFAIIYVSTLPPQPGNWYVQAMAASCVFPTPTHLCVPHRCLAFLPLMVLLTGSMAYLAVQIPLTPTPTRTIVGLWLGVAALLLAVAILIPLQLDGTCTSLFASWSQRRG